MEIENIKKDYLRRVIAASLYNRNYSTVVFFASYYIDEDIKKIIEELKDEFHIENLVFIDFDYDKIKSFYYTDPTEKEIENFIPKFPKPVGNIKNIYFDNAKTDLSNNYYSNYSKQYYNRLRYYNKELFDIQENLSNDDQTVTVCPNKEWAESLFGNQEKLQELWIRCYKVLLNPDVEKVEAIERIQRKDELNRIGIRKLSFYTNSGTDFKIALNPHSIWVCNPNSINGIANYFNYPSYEIFTSPNCYSAEGKIVLTKKERFYYDEVVENATFEFSKGRLINCKSNSEMFDRVVLNKPNKMNRIGEIALVSPFSPLAKTREFYDSLLLDENTGCHFALGNSLEDCIGVDKEKLEKNGARYYRYNTSSYHTDLVFGDDSISVEVQTKANGKVLIMEKGKWKI